jgi:hypothetical protein
MVIYIREICNHLIYNFMPNDWLSVAELWYTCSSWWSIWIVHHNICQNCASYKSPESCLFAKKEHFWNFHCVSTIKDYVLSILSFSNHQFTNCKTDCAPFNIFFLGTCIEIQCQSEICNHSNYCKCLETCSRESGHSIAGQ